VIDAALEQASQDNSLLHIETTSSQVNQFGGYTHTTPMQFAEFIHSAAERAGLEPGQVLLGGDHLGPFPWRNEPSSTALKKACELVNQCVLAGYQKIHLDASMACADDPKTGVTEKTVAERAALLCRTAEEAFRELPAESPQCVYVVGTEVPTPGGESAEGQPPSVTTAEHANRTLEIFRAAFEEAGLTSAWQRVIALVVQPGVEFGSNNVFDYDPGKAQALRSVLSQHPEIVFEAHSTDYQTQAALTRMVSDHFAILKVGPWLTFAYREAVLALSGIEQELLTSTSSRKPSNVRKALETVMMADPSQWKSYYHGSSEDIGRDLIYALSDRCRYYWNQPPVQAELARLFHNLRAITIPLTLLSQYLPFEYEVIRAGTIAPSPEGIIRCHIRRVLSAYAAACSLRESS
jgi:D-tagatose-1,6-bisphosphate aldolase subunit GatZ/KbaZ